jgi:hypothetical protein
MSKELEIRDLPVVAEAAEIVPVEFLELNDLSLALVGGGNYVVAL